MSDAPKGKKISVDGESAQQAISRLRRGSGAVAKTELWDGSDWGDSEYLSEFHQMFSSTMSLLGRTVTATVGFSEGMAGAIEGTVRDMHAVELASAVEVELLLEGLNDSRTGASLSVIGGAGAPLPGSTPGNVSDIAAMMQGDSGGDADDSSRSGGGRF